MGLTWCEAGCRLVHKTQVVSEFGEPLTWKKDGLIDSGDQEYALCRCGLSQHKPFCDCNLHQAGFDGSERARTDRPSDFQMAYPCKNRLVVKNDLSLCINSGFCGLRNTNLFEIMAGSDDSKNLSLVIAIVERCPSGALTYRMDECDEDLEPDLPQQVAVTSEITSSGPIQGPLWVTGSIEIIRADGQHFEPRNRVTLCNCGLSNNKPLCDGTHRSEAERTA